MIHFFLINLYNFTKKYNSQKIFVVGCPLSWKILDTNLALVKKW